MQKPSPWSRAYFSEALAPAEFTPSMCLLWRWLGGDASMWSEAVHWMHWLSVLPGDEGQGQLMPEFCQGLLGINYKAFCGWLLFVLGFEVPNRAQVANQGELLLVLGLGPLSKRYEAC